jgi:hypothetical protein
MKITERKPAAEADDFLTTVARSIGSTLGTVAAKVDEVTHPARRRNAGGKRARKHVSVFRTGRRASAPASKRSNATARLRRKNRKKSSK